VVEKDVLAGRVPRTEAQPLASPVARKMAAETGVDLSALPVEDRRIMKADVEAALAQTPAQPAGIRPAPESASGKPPAPASAAEIVPMSGLRGIIAERMGKSAHSTARVTLTTDVDATEFVQLRTQLKVQLEPTLGFAVSFNAILVAMAARAVREFPYVNVRWTEAGMQSMPHINVGVADDTERGLLVPVIREADHKGIADIARSLRELATRALAGKSTPDDLTGGTFTITNLGMFDIDAFTPIINLPECAILGVGRIREMPAVHAGQMCVRKMMVLSLTFDHRLVDGAPAARFLQRIKQYVEQPYLLLA
jgi:pyruvate dehydrogenase E2 component (dihydrolipoamide acetyltransferase)